MREALSAINQFFTQPILNSPYECPQRHWELDSSGQPTLRIKEFRRPADFITPIPKPKGQKAKEQQGSLLADKTVEAINSKEQEYHKAIINEIRHHVAAWRALPLNEWKVTAETARLLAHWRTHKFDKVRKVSHIYKMR